MRPVYRVVDRLMQRDCVVDRCRRGGERGVAFWRGDSNSPSQAAKSISIVLSSMANAGSSAFGTLAKAPKFGVVTGIEPAGARGSMPEATSGAADGAAECGSTSMSWGAPTPIDGPSPPAEPGTGDRPLGSCDGSPAAARPPIAASISATHSAAPAARAMDRALLPAPSRADMSASASIRIRQMRALFLDAASINGVRP